MWWRTMQVGLLLLGLQLRLLLLQPLVLRLPRYLKPHATKVVMKDGLLPTALANSPKRPKEIEEPLVMAACPDVAAKMGDIKAKR